MYSPVKSDQTGRTIFWEGGGGAERERDNIPGCFSTDMVSLAY